MITTARQWWAMCVVYVVLCTAQIVTLVIR